jgi:hypothetical protein
LISRGKSDARGELFYPDAFHHRLESVVRFALDLLISVLDRSYRAVCGAVCIHVAASFLITDSSRLYPQ